MENDVKVSSKSNMQKNIVKKLVFCWGILKVKLKMEGSGSASGSESGSISQRHGSADPDPHQNVIDPQHCNTGTYMVITGAPQKAFQAQGKFVSPQREHPKNTGSLTPSIILATIKVPVPFMRLLNKYN
jgi:hypothetical protein